MAMIDMKRLLRFVDDDQDAIVDMAQAFLASAPGELVKARSAAATGDLKQLAFSLHKLKSSVAIFHVGPTTAKLAELESQALAGEASRLAASLAELDAGLTLLTEEVRTLLNKP